jgi:hypothetical protein
MKIAINTMECGDFELSPKAVQRLAELQNIKCYVFTRNTYDNFTSISFDDKHNIHNIYRYFTISNPNETENRYEYQYNWWEEYENRNNPLLIQVIEELGEESYGDGILKIVEIPDNIIWSINQTELGEEWVYEQHRTWY